MIFAKLLTVMVFYNFMKITKQNHELVKFNVNNVNKSFVFLLVNFIKIIMINFVVDIVKTKKKIRF